jgi:hypothetical protein
MIYNYVNETFITCGVNEETCNNLECGPEKIKAKVLEDNNMCKCCDLEIQDENNKKLILFYSFDLNTLMLETKGSDNYKVRNLALSGVIYDALITSTKIVSSDCVVGTNAIKIPLDYKLTDFININQFILTDNKFTISFWVYYGLDPTLDLRSRCILTLNNTIKIYSTYTYFELSITNTYGNISQKIYEISNYANKWCHFAWASDGKDWIVYINNNKYIFPNNLGIIANSTYGNNRLCGDTSTSFYGKLDEFKLYNSILNDDDITNIYNQGKDNIILGEKLTFNIYSSGLFKQFNNNIISLSNNNEGFTSINSISGPCYVSFNPPYHNAYIGLSEYDYETVGVKYGCYSSFNNNTKINSLVFICPESSYNQIVQGPPQNDNNYTIKIVYNGLQIIYYLNNEIIMTYDKINTASLYCVGSIKINNTMITNLFFDKYDITTIKSTLNEYIDLNNDPKLKYYFTFDQASYDLTYIDSTTTNKKPRIINKNNGENIYIVGDIKYNQVDNVDVLMLNSNPTQYLYLDNFTISSIGTTFAFWFKGNNPTTWQRIFDFGNGACNNNILIATNGNSHFNYGVWCQGNDTNTTGKLINFNDRWLHFAWTLDNNSKIWKTYLNGNLIQTRNNANYPKIINRTKAFIGKSNWNDPNLNGMITDFRIYDRVLSNKEIIIIYNNHPLLQIIQLYKTLEYDTFKIAAFNLTIIPDINKKIEKLNSEAIFNIILDNNIITNQNKNNNIISTNNVLISNYDNIKYLDIKTTKDYLTIVPFKITSEGITISLWFNCTVPNNGRLFDFGNGVGRNNIFIMMMNAKPNANGILEADLGFYVYANNSYKAVGMVSGVTANVWTHIVWIIDTNKWTIYKNNIRTIEMDITFYPDIIVRNINYIGKSWWGTPHYSGYIDDFRLYNKVLNIDEIKTLYNFNNLNNLNTDEALVIYYNFTNIIKGSNNILIKNNGLNEYTVSYSVKNLGKNDMETFYQYINKTNNNINAIINSKGKINLTTTSNFLIGINPLNYDGRTIFTQLEPINIKPNGISISVWFKSNNSSNWARVFDFGNGSHQNNILMAILHNTLTLFIFNSNNQYTQVHNVTKINMNDNIWRNVIWIIDPVLQVWKIYLNSILVYTLSPSTYSGFIFRYPNTDVVLKNNYLGKSNWNDPYFNGSIDDFRFYDKVLSDDEISTIGLLKDLTTLNKDSTLQISRNLGINYTPKNGIKSLTLNKNLQEYLIINPLTITNNGLTFSLWFKAFNTDNFSKVVDFGNNSNDTINICINKSFLEFTIKVGINLFTYTHKSNVNDALWYHIVWTITDSIWTIYINGIKIEDRITANINYTFTSTKTNNFIGKGNSLLDSYFNGQIDDFKLYNRILLNNEILNLFNITTGVNNNALLLDFDFENIQTSYRPFQNEINGNLYSNDLTPNTMIKSINVLTTNKTKTLTKYYLNFIANKKQYLQIDKFKSSNNGMTFSVWFKTGGTQQWSRLFDFGNTYDNKNIGIAFNQNGSILHFFILGNSKNLIDNVNFGDFTTNYWIHLVWTLDYVSNKWLIYRDGNLIYEKLNAPYPDYALRKNNFLGKSNWPWDPYYNGSIHKFRMYSRILSDNEIKGIYYQENLESFIPIKILPYNGLVLTGNNSTNNETSINYFTGYDTFRNGTYKSSCAGLWDFGWQSFNAFNPRNNGGCWHSADSGNHPVMNNINKYTRSPYNQGNYQGGGDSTNYFTFNINDTIISGEWLQIELPYTITLKSYNFIPRPGWFHRLPGEWYVIGLNINDQWEIIDYKNEINNQVDSTTNLYYIDTDKYKLCKTFKLIVPKLRILNNPGDSVSLNITRWELLGGNENKEIIDIEPQLDNDNNLVIYNNFTNESINRMVKRSNTNIIGTINNNDCFDTTIKKVNMKSLKLNTTNIVDEFINLSSFNITKEGITISLWYRYYTSHPKDKYKILELQGSFINIASGTNNLFAIDPKYNIWYCENITNNNFIKIPGNLIQISYDISNNILMGINNNNEIFYADQNIYVNPNWTKLEGNLKNISVSNKKFYGVNTNNEIFYCNDYKNIQQMIKVPGSLMHVSYDGYNNIVVGTNSDSGIFYANANIDTNPTWIQLSGGLRNVYISNNQLFGTNTSNQLFYSSNYTTGNWEYIGPEYKSVSFDGGNNVIYCINTKNQLYSSKFIIDSAKRIGSSIKFSSLSHQINIMNEAKKWYFNLPNSNNSNHIYLGDYNDWFHIVWIINKTNNYVCINGQQVKTFEGGINNGLYNSNYIGGKSDWDIYYELGGSITEFKIIGREITNDEKLGLYYLSKIKFNINNIKTDNLTIDLLNIDPKLYLHYVFEGTKDENNNIIINTNTFKNKVLNNPNTAIPDGNSLINYDEFIGYYFDFNNKINKLELDIIEIIDSDITISFWYKCDTVNDTFDLINFSNDKYFIKISMTNNLLVINLDNKQIRNNYTTINLVNNIWNFISFVINRDSTIKLYINSNLEFSDIIFFPAIGYKLKNSFGPACGFIADFRLYRRRLFENEIILLFKSKMSTIKFSSNLVINYEFNDLPIYNSIKNLVSNENDGTVNDSNMISKFGRKTGNYGCVFNSKNLTFLVLPPIKIKKFGFTISFWYFQMSGLTNNATIFEISNYNSDEIFNDKQNITISMSTTGTNLNCVIKISGIKVATYTHSTNINLKNYNWQYITWTLNYNGISNIYINSELYSRIKLNSSKGFYPDEILFNYCFIGKSFIQPNKHIDAYMDSFKFYDGVLSNDDIINIIKNDTKNSLDLLKDLNNDPFLSIYYSFKNKFISNDQLYNLGRNEFDTLINKRLISATKSIIGLENLIITNLLPRLNYKNAEFIELPEFTNSDLGLTFTCCIKGNNVKTNWNRIFEFSNGPNVDFIICALVNNTLALQINNTQIINFCNVNINDNKWHNIVWNLNIDGRWIVYVDGYIVLNKNGYPYPQIKSRTQNFLGLSISAVNDSTVFNGEIDDFRVYNRSLNYDEIKAILNFENVKQIIDITPTPPPAFSPTNAPLSFLQKIFEKAGCVSKLTDNDTVKLWRNNNSILEIKNNMEIYANKTNMCCGTREELDFCNSTACLKDWVCAGNINVPLRINKENNVECMSSNNKDCLAQSTNLECINLIKNQPKIIKPLSCGPMHSNIYGTTGYENPNSWCNSLSKLPLQQVYKIRIQATSFNYLQLAQIVILDASNNIVTPLSVSASAPGWGTNINIPIDGTKSARPYPNIYHSQGGVNDYYELVIRPTIISNITIYNRSDCCSERIQAFSLYLKNENDEIITSIPLVNVPIQVYTYAYAKLVYGTIFNDNPNQFCNASPELINKVRIQATNFNYLQLAQVIIIDINNNVIIPLSVSGSPPGWGTNLNTPIDGTRSARPYPNIYHSPGGSDDFYELVINPTTIKSVTIYNRNDCCSERIQSFTLYLKNGVNDTLASIPLINVPVQTYIYANSRLFYDA